MTLKKIEALILCVLLAAMSLAACGPKSAPVSVPDISGESGTQESAEMEETSEELVESEVGNMEKSLHLYINDNEIAVEWESNESVEALAELAAAGPITVRMSTYGGFEQVGPLGTRLPSSDRQTMTSAGDIVLYSGNQIVIFYGSNSWAYTRLGKAADKTASDMKELLGNGDVTVTISCE